MKRWKISDELLKWIITDMEKLGIVCFLNSFRNEFALKQILQRVNCNLALFFAIPENVHSFGNNSVKIEKESRSQKAWSIKEAFGMKASFYIWNYEAAFRVPSSVWLGQSLRKMSVEELRAIFNLIKHVCSNLLRIFSPLLSSCYPLSTSKTPLFVELSMDEHIKTPNGNDKKLKHSKMFNT